MLTVREGCDEAIPPPVYGAAAEHLAAAELLFGGHDVAWPAFALASVASSLNFLPGSRRGISPVVGSYEDAWHVFDEGFDLAPQIQLGEVVLEVAL